MSEQRKGKTAHQTSHAESERTGSQMPVQHQGQTSEHTDRKLSSHTERASKQTGHTPSVSSEQRASEQMGRRKSGQDNRRSSEPIDRRKSGQYERKASEPIDHIKSAQDARRASAPIPHRESGQDDQAPYELIDSRKSGLVERKVYEQVEHRLSDPIGYKTSVKTHHKAHDQIIELAEDQAAEDQVAVSTHHPRVIMPLYSEYEKVVDEDDIDDNQPDVEESDESDGRIHTSKKGKEADSKLDPKQKDFRDSKVSDKTKSENDAFMKAFNAFDSKVISTLQTKDHNFSPRFPAISTKLDYVINQEKSHIIVTKPVG